MRSSPTPSAPSATARAASPAAPRLANTSICAPSRVDRRLVGAARSAAARRAATARAVRSACASVARRRVDRHRAGLAVEQQRRAVGDRQHRRARGRPRPAAPAPGPGSAAWAVVEPRAVAIAEHALGVERGRVGGGELVGDDDPAVSWHPRAGRPQAGCGRASVAVDGVRGRRARRPPAGRHRPRPSARSRRQRLRQARGRPPPPAAPPRTRLAPRSRRRRSPPAPAPAARSSSSSARWASKISASADAGPDAPRCRGRA